MVMKAVGRAWSVKRLFTIDEYRKPLRKAWLGATEYEYGIGPAHYPVPAILTDVRFVSWLGGLPVMFTQTHEDGYWRSVKW